MNVDKLCDNVCDTWMLATRTGIHVCVPPSMRNRVTYVMLEQEGWYEPELGLMPRLLQRGMNALDIGAAHGLYTLEMARCAPGGRILSFEPDPLSRANLQRSLQANGWTERVTVVDAALAETQGYARTPRVPSKVEVGVCGPDADHRSEAGRGDPLRVETLDHYLAQHAPGLIVDVLRLGSGRDPLGVLVGGQRFFETQSPVVLFALQPGQLLNPAVMACWQMLGFDLFRWSDELGLLMPFDAANDEADSLLNLVAVRPEVQARLALRGLLVTAAALAETPQPQPDPRALNLWFARPALPSVDSALHQGGDAGQGDPAYLEALAAVASAHFQPRLSPAERVLLLLSARSKLMPALEGALGYGPEAWTLLVHCLQALGQPHAAAQLAGKVLDRWPEDDLLMLPVAPPCVADLQRPRSTPVGPWLRQMLAEFVALQALPSSCFAPPAPAYWAALLEHPDHGAEIERRYLLSNMVQDRVASTGAIRHLPSPVHTGNPMLWQALLQATRAMSPHEAQAPAGT